jgi:endonuclease YncB( thermonuclease family)
MINEARLARASNLMQTASLPFVPCWRTALESPKLRSLLLAAMLLWGLPAQAQWRIDRVLDGDSLVLRDRTGQRLNVRITGIDAPEKSQPFADRSRQHLRSISAGCAPTLDIQKTDRYGRSVAQVQCADRDLGLAQIEAGLAWHFTRYELEQKPAQRSGYSEAQRQARAARRGLWSEAAPTAPWLFRAQRRQAAGQR